MESLCKYVWKDWKEHTFGSSHGAFKQCNQVLH